MKKILWITPRWPMPASDGAKIATLELLKTISSEAELELHLVALLARDEPVPKLPWIQMQSVDIIRREVTLTSPLLRMIQAPWIPITFGSFLGIKIQEQLLAILARHSWDAIIFDGIHAAIPFFKIDFPKIHKFYYRAHNAEFLLWERTAKQNGLFKKLALFFQAFLVKKFETRLIQNCACTLPVSEEDAAHFKKMVPNAKIEIIRIGQNFQESVLLPKPEKHAPSSLVLGFIGRLDWLPNREGLAWFLKTIWPKVSALRPELSLLIAGSGDASWLKLYQSLEKIKYLGKLSELDTFYQQIDLSLVPLFIGSGTRVKVIEASKYKVPCLSTALGVEGSGLKPSQSFLRAETEQEWVQVLSSLDQGKLSKIGLNAFHEMKDQYDSKNISKIFLRTLFGLSARES